MNESPSTSSTPAHGSAAAGSVAPAGSSGVMPANLGDLAKRLVDAAKGGAAPAAVAEPERRGLSELTLRVLARVGSFPVKVLAVFTGGPSSVATEDAQLIGECAVDVVRHSAAAPDPATEAWGRLVLVVGGVVGEGYLARLEERLKKKRASEGLPGA